MNYIGKAYSSPVFNEVACLHGVPKMGPKHALGIGGKKTASWTSFLFRNDFGIMPEEHETIGKPPSCMRMM